MVAGLPKLIDFLDEETASLTGSPSVDNGYGFLLSLSPSDDDRR